MKPNPEIVEQLEDPTQGEFADYVEFEEGETAYVSLCEGQYNTSMKFKGKIGSIPICAFMDNGSTHSFIHPDIICNLGDSRHNQTINS